MKFRKLYLCVLSIGMLIGCKDCDDALRDALSEEAFRVQLTMNGRTYSATKRVGFLQVGIWKLNNYYVCNDSVFRFHFWLSLPDEQAPIEFLECGVLLPELPEMGKEYALMDYIDEYIDTTSVVVHDYREGVWFKMTDRYYPYQLTDTLNFFPEDGRKKQLIMRSTRLSGYIVFDELEFERPNKSWGQITGRFALTATLTNYCYPELEVPLIISNATFSYGLKDVENSTNNAPLPEFKARCWDNW